MHTNYLSTIKRFLLVILLVVVQDCQAQYQLQDNEYDLNHLDLNYTSSPGQYLDGSKFDDKGNLWLVQSHGFFCYDGYNAKNVIRHHIDPKDPVFLKFGTFNDSLVYAYDTKKYEVWIYNYVKRDLVGILAMPSIHSNPALTPSGTYIAGYTDFDSSYHHLIEVDLTGEITYLAKTQFQKERRRYEQYGAITFHNNNIYTRSGDSILIYNQFGKKLKSFRFANPHSVEISFFHFQDKIAYIDDFRLYLIDKNLERSISPLIIPQNILQDIEKYVWDGSYLWLVDYAHAYRVSLESMNYQDYSESYLNYKHLHCPEHTDRLINDAYSRNGTLYLIQDHGIVTLTPKNQPLDHYLLPLAGDYPNPSIRAIDTFSNGDMLVAYYNGLNIKRSGSKDFELYDFPHREIDQPYGLSIIDDEIYISNAKIEGKEFQFLDNHRNFIHAPHTVYNDTLYFTRFGEPYLSKYNVKTKEKWEVTLDSLCQSKTQFINQNDLVLDPLGRGIWIASSYNGISLVGFDSKTIINMFDLKGIQNGYIHDLEIVGDTIYIASNFGLGTIDIRSFETDFHQLHYIDQYSQKKAKHFYSIISTEDALLIGTDKGLVSYDTDSQLFSQLNHDDPINDLEFNRQATFKQGNQVYMGTTNGLYTFDITDLVWNTEQCNQGIYLTSFSTSKRGDRLHYPLDNNNISISANETNLTVEFSRPSQSDAIYYAHRITNIDSTWSEYDQANSLSFFQLPIGHNHIEVKAIDSQGRGEYEIFQLDIHQEQFWYKRWWAFLLYALGFMGVVYMIYKYRINQFLKYQQLRTQISSDLHDDVGSILASVAMQSEMMGYQSDKVDKEKFQIISNLSREAMANMRDTVWAIDSRKDDYKSLIFRILDHLANTFEGHRMSFDFNYEEDLFNHRIDQVIRQNLYLIVKEAITNAAKHSNGDNLSLELKREKSQISLLICDNGNVNPEAIKQSGLGLENMQMRANKIDGQLVFNYTKGFCIHLTVAM